MPKIVQFTHPGKEHGHDRNNEKHKGWNTKGHQRKFLLADGKYQSENTLCEDQLIFWGEWEPPSEVEQLTIRPTGKHPQWLHRPYLPQILPVSRGYQESYQNTDPCVFDGAFKYFVCKQFKPKSRSVTQLAKLERGSLILFGSTANQNTQDAFFQIDTVFVVSSFIEYDMSTVYEWEDTSLGRYLDYSVRMAFPSKLDYSRKLRLYFGATFDDKVEGMYSFSPSMIYHKGLNKGFPRIKISNSNYITNNLNAAPRISTAEFDQVFKFWSEIRAVVAESGCVEGVEFSYTAK